MMSEACKDELGRIFYSKDLQDCDKEEYRRRIDTTIPKPPWMDVPVPTVVVVEKGRKFDGGKLQYGLIPPLALKETVKVLTLGAVKYDKNNWQKVPNAQSRYYDALQRHLWDWFAGEQLDPETGINHLAHAMCNIMFLLERDIHTEEEWEEIVKSVDKK